MALPESAPIVTCTLSKPLMAEGTVGEITSAYLTIDRPLVWAASGETVYSEAVQINPTPEGTLLFSVIPVDAAGVLDLAGNLIANWVYKLRANLVLDSGLAKTVDYEFQPMLADVVFDLDLQPQVDAVSVPPATISGQEVLIVIGSDWDDLVIDGGVL